jgi:hypothetical protein
MKPKFHRFLMTRGAGAALLLAMMMPTGAAEPRTWISIDGRMIEAELLRRLGADVELRDKDGRISKVPMTSLSFADQDYVNEFAPEDKTKSLAGSTPTGAKPKLPNPAKDAKLDTKVYNKAAGLFKVNDRSYNVCETPHFKVLFMKPVDPMDVAELAERLWLDTAFFHSTFTQKWKDRKMAIMLVNDEEAYEDAGSWFADMLNEAGQKDQAGKTRATWPKSASGTIYLPSKVADDQGVHTQLRVFRAFERSQYGGKAKPNFIKGVWIPFRTHCLASDMLNIQAGGVSGIGAAGSFAIFTGHAYYKEILLTGRSETSILRATGTGNDVSGVGGFKDAKSWAPELKKRVKKGDARAAIAELFGKDQETADEVTTVLAYSFARFLQSSQEKLSAFNKLCERISTSNQIPEPDDIAKFYGLENTAALEKAWVAYIESAEFR